MMVNVIFIFSFAFRINIQITISLNRCANFVDMIRWSRNLKDCTFSHHPSTSAASLTHWTCDWYTYNFCCQHMVCDKPHSPVLHPCESDSINFRETQLKFFQADAWLLLFQALGWSAIVWKSWFFSPSSSFTWFCFYCQLEVLHNPKYLWKFKLKYLSLQVGEVKIYYIFSVVVRFRILFRYVNLCIFMEISDIHKIKRNIWKHFLLKWRRIIK